MAWDVELTDEFIRWWNELDTAEKDSLAVCIELLEEKGPNLGRPFVDSVNGSRHSNMKELRTQHQGRPYRSFFALTLAEQRSCSSAERKQATNDFMIEWFRLQMISMTTI